MSKDLMNYKAMVEAALRDVVRLALTRIADSGLPGNHHIYLTFKTHLAGVLMPEYLRQKNPEEMTIVLQHQFWGLTVHDDSFSITLSFNNERELLAVPLAAVIGFVDPSVEFGLQFHAGPEPETSPRLPDAGQPSPSSAGDDNVVALDRFRKE
jgi:hypothetical protein